MKDPTNKKTYKYKAYKISQSKTQKIPTPTPTLSFFPSLPSFSHSLSLSLFFLFLSLICSLLYIFALYVKYFLCSFGCIYVYIDDTYLVWQNMLALLFQFWSSPCPILMQQMMLHCIFYVRVIFIY